MAFWSVINVPARDGQFDRAETRILGYSTVSFAAIVDSRMVRSASKCNEYTAVVICCWQERRQRLLRHSPGRSVSEMPAAVQDDDVGPSLLGFHSTSWLHRVLRQNEHTQQNIAVMTC